MIFIIFGVYVKSCYRGAKLSNSNVYNDELFYVTGNGISNNIYSTTNLFQIVIANEPELYIVEYVKVSFAAPYRPLAFSPPHTYVDELIYLYIWG